MKIFQEMQPAKIQRTDKRGGGRGFRMMLANSAWAGSLNSHLMWFIKFLRGCARLFGSVLEP